MGHTRKFALRQGNPFALQRSNERTGIKGLHHNLRVEGSLVGVVDACSRDKAAT